MQPRANRHGPPGCIASGNKVGAGPSSPPQLSLTRLLQDDVAALGAGDAALRTCRTTDQGAGRTKEDPSDHCSFGGVPDLP